MKQIRKSVFETNSSSSHSLTMGKGDLCAEPFSKEVLRAGVVAVSMGSYGWEWHRYYSAMGKLQYLVTQMFERDGIKIPQGTTPAEFTAQMCKDNDRLAMLCRVVQEHTGCALELQASRGGVDHESQGAGYEAYGSDDTLRKFLFDPTAYIETGNDNDSAPWQIDTDRGEEHYYEPAIRDVPADFVGVDLLQPGYDPLQTPGGAVLSPRLNAELYARIRAEGTVSFAARKSIGPYDWSSRDDDDDRGYCAKHVWENGEGLHLSRYFDTAYSFTEDKSIGYRPDDYHLTVQLPAELAAKVQALPRTPEVLVKLAKAESDAEYWEERAKEEGADDHDRTSFHSALAEVEDLRTEAQNLGVL